MSSLAHKNRVKAVRTAAGKQQQPNILSRFRVTRRSLSLTMLVLALSYAFLAGCHTFFDPDLGWHMATARYMVQHRMVPTTDVFSYTSPGAPWRYSPFAGIVFFGIHRALGYSGLTWFCSIALLTLVIFLLRAPAKAESIMAALLAILAIPIVALRMSPHPDLFTHLFFAIFIVQLWRFHSSEVSADALRTWRIRLWLLPIVMVIWVNFHPGFVVGIGEVLAYLLLEVLELPIRSRRGAALRRLHQAWLPLAAVPMVTLLNPYGYRIFDTSLTLAGLHPTNLGTGGVIIGELQAVPLPRPDVALSLALDWRDPNSSFWWLVLVAVVAVAVALWQRRFGAALLLAAGLCVGLQRVRYNGLFAILIVVVGSTILTRALAWRDEARMETETGPRQTLPLAAVGVVLCVCLLTCVRGIDLLSSRSYVLTNSNAKFGAGQSSWFPERAADFILREHIPGNVFPSENLGGFSIWRLYPAYRDFIDGRNVSPSVVSEYLDFSLSPPDSPKWEVEIARRGINTLFLSLARFPGTDTQYLRNLCQSHLFRPVYMDDVSMVLLRNSPENRPWLDRLQFNCDTFHFTPPANASHVTLSDFYANEGTIELFLGRFPEAKQALEQSARLAPEDPIVHLALGNLYVSQRQSTDAEREYKTAVSVRKNNSAARYGLALFYTLQHRFAEARPLADAATQLDAHPAIAYCLLGRIDLGLDDPERALADFALAEQASTEWRGREDQNPTLFVRIAEGRAAVYAGRREWKRAIEYQQDATRRAPGDPSLWQMLATIYAAAGDTDLAGQAQQKSRALLH